MANVITLTGPAHCGKSSVSNLFMENKSEVFKPIRFRKYTTRAQRKNSDDDVICIDKIPPKCDIVYEQYGVRYGLELRALYEHLEKEETPIIVLNDIRAVEDIKAALGSLVISIFLYRKPALINEFIDEERGRSSGTFDEEIHKIANTRYEKAQAIYRIYIENIDLFDNVILNVSDMDCTREQVNHVVNKISREAELLKV